MFTSFHEKFALTLKFMSLSRGQLAANLGVDKSVVGRWASGAGRPSGHNLARLSALIGERVDGFSMLDWELDLAEFARRLGVHAGAIGGRAPSPTSTPELPLALMSQIADTTAMRAGAYEGFFRSTRPYLLQPGRFLHDYGVVRRAPNGLLSLRMGTGGFSAEGWMLPLQNQVFIMVCDVVSGALVFGIFNGAASARVDVVDGLILGAALDPGRTPTASAMMFERIGDLSDDLEADDARFAELMARDPVAPAGSVPEPIVAHLLRDFGPAELAAGGDLLLRVPLIRSLARGAAYREPSPAAQA